ncbi:MAG: hypothetical protein Q7R98_00395 [Candidatus Jorgensenbacteria bacterium]|nr:hypothetical protein [Candidatus Jorgensenbacteria bacterium]
MEVVLLLKSLGWNVELSTYYHDDISDKPREIDIVASRDCPVGVPGRGQTNFKIFLFIECKYFKEGVAFRMYDNQEKESRSAIITNGFSANILRDSGFAEKHHYVCASTVGKLYDSKENDEVFKSLTGAVKSLAFFKESRNEKGIFYPIVVYDGVPGLYEITNNDFSKLDSAPLTENIVFHLNYSYRSAVTSRLSNQSFCVDFVRKSELGKFLTMVKGQEINEIEKFAQFLLMKGRQL